ncbi:MAG TPA: hypothetical protein VHY08_15965 [Bacillota bacterium]|nr:hypothetical protein [Bacillota bacterium]
MAKKVLENINTGCTWTSYIAAVDGVLRHMGWWRQDTPILMGQTGIGFHFIIHQNVCPSGPTVYDWINVHLQALDRLGIHTDVYQAFNDGKLDTFPQIRNTAVQKIKESIDRGIAVVIWTPTPILEFGIIYGYNDADEVFFVKDYGGADPDPLRYCNLGQSEVPILFYQIFLDQVAYDPEKSYRSSLEYGVGEWTKESHINPAYATGRKGYDNLIRSLEQGDFNEFGLAYNLAVYHDAKQKLANYLEYLSTASQKLPSPNLKQAAGLFQQVAAKYARMVELVPFSGANGVGGRVDRQIIPEILQLTKEAKQLEESAMHVIEETIKK